MITSYYRPVWDVFFFFIIHWHSSTLRQPILLKQVLFSYVYFSVRNRHTCPCFSDLLYFVTIFLNIYFIYDKYLSQYSFGIKHCALICKNHTKGNCFIQKHFLYTATVSQQTENIGQHSQQAIDLQRGGEMN